MLFLAICGCAYYSFSGSALPAHLKTVSIPVFEDRTAEFGISELITEALINQITKDNTLKISDPRNADSVINGSITTIRDEAGTVNLDKEVQDIKIYITVDVEFVDQTKRNVIWQDRLTQWGTYEPDAVDGREKGIQEAVDKLVEDIVNNIIAGW
ncbi:LptE family protein [candidate division KSB1 bacterium]|nr:LptE family protein [candidate division KSB1 bacterium]